MNQGSFARTSETRPSTFYRLFARRGCIAGARNRLTVGILLTLAAVAAPALFGQAVSGVLTGYITDPSKTVIPGATVTATEMRTGVTTKRSTDTSGLYIITNLVPGIYSVTSRLRDFKSPCAKTLR